MIDSFFPPSIQVLPPQAMPVGKPKVALAAAPVYALAPVAGSLSVDNKLNSSVTSVAVTSSASLTVFRPLITSVAGLGATNNAPLGTAISLAGQVDGFSLVVGLMGIRYLIAGSVSGSASPAAALTRRFAVSASVAAACSSTAAISRGQTLAGAIVGVSDAEAAAGRVHAIRSSVAGQSDTAATAVKVRMLEGGCGAVTTVNAGLKMAWGLTGSITGQGANVTSLLGGKILMDATVAAAGGMSGTLGVKWGMRSTVGGQLGASVSTSRVVSFDNHLYGVTDYSLIGFFTTAFGQYFQTPYTELTHYKGWLTRIDCQSGVAGRGNVSYALAAPVIAGQSVVNASVIIPKQVAATVDGQCLVDNSLMWLKKLYFPTIVACRLTADAVLSQTVSLKPDLVSGRLRLLYPVARPLGGYDYNEGTEWVRVRYFSPAGGGITETSDVSATLNVAWKLGATVAAQVSSASAQPGFVKNLSSARSDAASSVTIAVFTTSSAMTVNVAGVSVVAAPSLKVSKPLTATVAASTAVVGGLARVLSETPREGQVFSAYRRGWTFTVPDRARIEGE